jgi:antibiotic biosynthesis monooxygenase (ABM) superfamily enzyme
MACIIIDSFGPRAVNLLNSFLAAYSESIQLMVNTLAVTAVVTSLIVCRFIPQKKMLVR